MISFEDVLSRAIGDEEIADACVRLGLPSKAFHGPNDKDTRLDALRSNSSIDVAACPGSGKTTLLVAKLAILAKRWPSSSSGVCVLSHTNVARVEIEKKLGTDPVGRALLSYPHFIGTIHGFINQFIAVPWLRSNGINIVAIDDELCLRRRLGKLSPALKSRLLETKRAEQMLRIRDARYDLGEITWGKGKLGRDTLTYKAFLKACSDTTAEGFFCHDDMLIWAAEALNQTQDLVSSVRTRFPVLFLDEVQDNSDEQSRLLHQIFMEGQGPVVRQRFGDMNQAIFGRASDPEKVTAQMDAFPNADITVPVTDSHRFGSQIAKLADPLALSSPGLIGLRQHTEDDLGRQASILLFDAANPKLVLPAFAALLLSRFTLDQCRTADFAAIGAIHRDTNRHNTPNCVAHYLEGYDPSGAKPNDKPATLIGYLRRGIAESASTGDIWAIVDRAADGILRLSTVLDPAARHPEQLSKYRQLLRLLEPEPNTIHRFQSMCQRLAAGELPKDASVWGNWKTPCTDIARSLLPNGVTASADAFLNWEEDNGDSGKKSGTTNLFTHPGEDPLVKIKVGSIHSVKGETHLATLVLDTHFNGSHFKRIKPWLLGSKSGLAAHKVELRKSLKQHYVAMTRPSHLLCLAMRSDLLTNDEILQLQARSWTVGDVVEDRVVWKTIP